MRIFLIIFVALWSGCLFKRQSSDNALIEQSVSRLQDVLQKKITDTAAISIVLASAFDIADKYSNKRHDSLIAWGCRLKANDLMMQDKTLAARGFYLKGLQFGTRNLRPAEDIIIRLYRNTALSYFGVEDYPETLIYLDSVKISSSDSVSSKWKTEDALKKASCYEEMGEHLLAEHFYLDAIPQAKKYFSNSDLANAHIGFSMCLKSLKKLAPATGEAATGIHILEKQKLESGSTDMVNLFAGYLHLANILKDSGLYKEAEKNYRHSETLGKSVNDTLRIEVALLGLGLAYRLEKQFSLSEKTLTGGLDMIRQKGEVSPFLLSLTEKYYSERSLTYMAAKKYNAAISDQDSAMDLLTRYKNDPVLNADLNNERHNLLSLMSDKAMAFMSLYDAGADKKGYDKARAIFDSLPTALEDLRANYIGESAKLDLEEKAKPSFEKAVGLFITMYQRKKDKKYLYAAFDFAEQSKNMILFDHVRLNNRLPDSLQKERKAVSQMEAGLSGTNDAEALQQMLTRKRNLVEKIKAYAVAQKTSVPNIQRKILKDGRSAMIEYFVGDSVVYAFGITENDIRIQKIPKAPDFGQKLSALREAAIQKKNEVFASASYDMYKILLDSVLSYFPTQVRRLILVPDGSLNYVAFESLLQRPVAPAGSSLKGASFLIRKYAVGYAPSANLLLEQTSERAVSAGSDFAAFAPAYRPRDTVGGKYATRDALSRDGAYDLPDAKKEARQLGQLLNGEIFLDDDATEAAFKQRAEHYKVLHLAMHAVVSERDPADSRLLFTLPNGDKKPGAGDLKIAELNALSLNADMAVLSACNTGFGKWSKGEGVMSLARAFQQAGVRSTVMSLWKAPDEQTKEIMIDFYKNLKSGMAKDEALQKAKTDFLDNVKMDKETSPFYWATFVLSGNNDPLVFSNPGRGRYIWTAVIFCFFAGSVFIFKNYRKNSNNSVKVTAAA